jgi:RND family efflux transporter MFP subunit
MKLRNALILIALAAVIAGAWVYWSVQPRLVTIAEVTRGTAAEIVYATGIVEPERWAKVTPLIRGRIVESCQCEGQQVGEGHLLFRLDDTEVRAHADELQALLDLAERELNRTSNLYSRGIVPREHYDRDLADVAKLRAAVAGTRSQIEDLFIRAPLTGTVLRIDGEVGEVAALGEALAWVGQPRPLLVIAEVNEEDIPRVAVGQNALIKADAFPAQALTAVVASITPMGNPELKTYRVRLALPPDTPLHINMSVDVNIIIRTVEDAVLAPAPALIGDRVQVVSGDGLVELRPVTTGIRGARMVEVTSGLEPGARVVSPALDGLAEGDRVRDTPAGKAENP